MPDPAAATMPNPQPVPQAQLLSNGRYTVMLTAAGAGYGQWHDCAITRWRADPTCDDHGNWLYLRDVETGEAWSAGFQPLGRAADEYAATFDPDRAVIARRDGDIETTTEVLVAGDDDLEVRRTSVRNGSGRECTIEVTSYSELVLAPSRGDAAHPAFSKLFVRTEWLPDRQLLVATRRVRSPDDPSACAAQWLEVEGQAVGETEWETDRARFIGRGGDARTPAALADGMLSNGALPNGKLSGSVGTVLDPVFALRRRVRIAPGETARLTLWTAAAASRDEALALAERWRAPDAFARASESASRHAQAMLGSIGIDDAQARSFQRLAAALLYDDPTLRAPSSALARGRGGPPTLWAGGISGDRPVALLRIRDVEGLALVDEALHARAFWNRHGLDTDLVVVAEGDGDTAALREAVQARFDDDAEQDAARDGKPRLFALRGNDAGEALLDGLATIARIVLDQRDGTLAAQVDALPAVDTAFATAMASTRPGNEAATGGGAEGTIAIGGLEFSNGHGGFADEGREYVTVIRDGRLPPMPWLNVVANPEFGFTATESGGGYAWSINSQRNPLLPWANDPVADPSQEVLYVRDQDDGRLFTATALPRCGDTAGEYVTHHGQGYTRFRHREHGIELDLLQYVPVDDGLKISRLHLRNRSGRARRLSVTAFVGWALDANGTRPAPFVATRRDEATGALFAANAWRAEFGERVAFVDLRGRQQSHTGDRFDFLGRHGGLDDPAALREGRPLSGRTGAGLDPCGALQATFELAAGGEDEIVLLLGDAADETAARALVQRYRDADLDAVLQAAKRQWDDILGAVQVRTPDRAMDLLLNRWLLYQALCCRVWARTAYYQASGAYGFRDQLQDVMATCIARPAETRAQLLRAAGRQFEEGDVQHWWLPPGGEGIRTRMTDDRLWLPFVACHYMEATGDTTLLDTRQSFIEGAEVAPGAHEAYYRPTESDKDASLYEHCARAIDASLSLGAHDLPLFGTGDWNDGMNRVGEQGRGESSWLGWFLCATIDAFAPHAMARGDHDRARRWQQVAATVRKGLDAGGWDGRWYRRGYYDDGTPLGSHESSECRIDAIAQSWSLIAGGGDPAHARSAMAEVDRQLILRDDKLALLFTPPLQHVDEDPGYIKAYPPGIRENGGQYTHGAQWSIFAFAKMGDGDRAGGLFSLINPIHHSATPEGVARYQVEPYVVAADVYSVAPHVGRGGWTWYTGSGAWLYRAGLEAILGFRKQGDRLCIDPCIPRDWPGFSIDYRHGGSHYLVEVANPRGACGGIAHCELDGEPLGTDPCLVPLVDDGRVHRVAIELGG